MQYQQPPNMAPQMMPQGANNQSGFSFRNFLLGNPGQYQQIQNVPQHHANALDQILQGGLGSLQNPYAGFDPIAQQTKNEFYSEFVPGLAERFTSAGGGGQRSSAFQGALGNAGSGLGALLNAQRAQYGLANRQQGLHEAQLGLAPQYENVYNPGQSGVAQDILPMLLNALVQAAPGLISGGIGAIPGAINLAGQGIGALQSAYGKYQQGKSGQTPASVYQEQQAKAQQLQNTQNQYRKITAQEYPALAKGIGPTSLQGPMQGQILGGQGGQDYSVLNFLRKNARLPF